MYSPEVQQRVKDLRAKVASGNYSLADYREAVHLLREGRLAAQAAAGKGKAKSAPKAPIDVAKIFADLDNIK